MNLIHSASCVAINGRALLIEGPPGSGKSSLALMLIDRGATLVSDDAARLEIREGSLFAFSAPNIAGLIEVRNLGLLNFPTTENLPVALVVRLDGTAPRFIEEAETVPLGGIEVPVITLSGPPGTVLAIKAELALERFGRS